MQMLSCDEQSAWVIFRDFFFCKVSFSVKEVYNKRKCL